MIPQLRPCFSLQNFFDPWIVRFEAKYVPLHQQPLPDNTISILITEPGKNSPNLRNKRLARPSVTAPRSCPTPSTVFVVQCNVWQSLMLHTYSGWGQERQRVTRLTSFMFCFQLAFGGWKTGLAKSACYAKCVPIWSDWILQKMSRYSVELRRTLSNERH